ncbi:MAG TPA: hypothetical protein ENK43_01325 [Planctomycetes bacterium]|nr:hypothetical protein [Planctomycetota bacterium]
MGKRWKATRLRWLVAGVLLIQLLGGGCILFYPSPPPVHFATQAREDGCVIDVVSMSRGRLDRDQNGETILHVRPGRTIVRFRVTSADSVSGFVTELSAVTGLKGGIVWIEGVSQLRGAIWSQALKEVTQTDPDYRYYYQLLISGRPASPSAFLVGILDDQASTLDTNDVREVPPDTVAQIERGEWRMSCRGEAGTSLFLDVATPTIGREFDIRAPRGTRVRINEGGATRTIEFGDDARQSLVLEPGKAKLSWFRSEEADAAIELSLDVTDESRRSTWIVFSSTSDQ